MRMSSFVAGFTQDATGVGDLGDETVADVAERIAELLGRSLPARVLDVLSEVAADLTDQLDEGRVEVRVAGDEVDLIYVTENLTGTHAPGERDDGDLSARITLRLGQRLKARVEEGAANEGLSVNAYVLRVLGRGAAPDRARGRSARSVNRLRGYGTT
jgi:hypothetical protein